MALFQIGLRSELESLVSQPETRFRHAPPLPVTLQDTGLSLVFLSELVLKTIYKAGAIGGADLARELGLPFPIIEEALIFLREDRYLEIKQTGDLGRVSGVYRLLDRGRDRAKEALIRSQYTGTAPVTLAAYTQQVERQSIKTIHLRMEHLQEAFADLVLDGAFFNTIGPAVNSGRSIFLYGPPGNGKTSIAKRIAAVLETRGGAVFLPKAIVVDDTIITLYDPIHHQSRESIPDESVTGLRFNRHEYDRRWVPCARPVVVVGGELTLDMLDLRYNPTTNYYDAPIHLKANGGVLVMDDFGRQRVDPKDLLNRWIVPLEEGHDYLTLHTGKKFKVPFDQLTAFATNLDPDRLVDEAFLRRIRYQIPIPGPTRETLESIFQLVCRQRGVRYQPAIVEMLYRGFYPEAGREPRNSDARDLIDRTLDLARFHGTPPEDALLYFEETARGFFIRRDFPR